MKLTTEHIEAFAKLSGDYNPLHLNQDYARKTPFGGVIAHGFASVLMALGVWADSKSFRLRQIRVQFLKPLCPDQDFEVLATSAAVGSTNLQIVSGKSTLTKIQLEWNEYDGAGAASFRSAGNWQKPDKYYSPNTNAADDIRRLFNLDLRQLPQGQLSALLWSTYFVGMVTPGKQALYSEFECEFDNEATDNPVLEISDLQTSIDERFNQVSITGKGTGIVKFTVQAFKRPESVSYSAEKVEVAIAGLSQNAKDYAGKSVFVSGGARGFGSVLAQAFNSFGARLFLNYRTPNAETEEFIARLRRDNNDNVTAIQADLQHSEDAERVSELLRQAGQKIDVLVLNAFPPILTKKAAELTPDEILKFIDRALSIQLRTFYAVHSSLSPNAKVIHVSSIYTKAPVKQLSHYIMAKAACEAFMQSLATEHKSLKFINVRPPQMLTDQTNGVLTSNSIPQATAVAKAFFEALATVDSRQNYFELNLTL